jgi:hypothetical protein
MFHLTNKVPSNKWILNITILREEMIGREGDVKTETGGNWRRRIGLTSQGLSSSLGGA